MAPVSTLSQYPTGIISVDETDPTFLPPMGQITVTKQAKVAPGNAVPAILVGIASAVILVAIVLHLVDGPRRNTMIDIPTTMMLTWTLTVMNRKGNRPAKRARTG